MLYFCCLKKACSINSLFKYKRSFVCLKNKQDKGFSFFIRKRSWCACGVAIATFLLGSGLIFQSNVKRQEPSGAVVILANIMLTNLQVRSSIKLMEEMPRAVDGNHDNAWNHRSVTHTDFSRSFLVKVDLEKEEL